MPKYSNIFKAKGDVMKSKYIALLFVPLLLSSCSNQRDVSNQLEINEKILTDKTKEIEQLTQTMEQLQLENNHLKDRITSYQNIFQLIQEKSAVLTEELNIFQPNTIQKGTKLGDLTVADIKKEETNGAINYFVSFSGEVEVNGSIVINQASDNKYFIIVDKDLVILPHSLTEFENGRMYLSISNEAALEAALGAKLSHLNDSSSLEITAIFKNFHYNDVPSTDIRHDAEFVRLAD